MRNVDDATIAALKARAAKHGRSVEAEHRAVLDELAREQSEAIAKAECIERARLHREETRGGTFTPSEVIVREMRDER